METQENIKVNISDKVKDNVILPEIDIKKYIGKKTIIDKVEEFKGQYGYFVKVTSKVIDIIPDFIDSKTNKPLELRASRIFGLLQDKENNIGWNEKTILGIYLSKMKAKNYNDLVGKEVIIQTILNKKNQKEFLTF